MRPIKETALAFDRACRSCGVRYALVGGFAVMAWGQPRATMDVDALVAIPDDETENWRNALEAEDFRLEGPDLRDALEESTHVSVLDRKSPYHVDVKFARTETERKELEDARDVAMEGGRLRIARPEYIIAFKLKFGTPQDLQDARSVWVRQRTSLDLSLLESLSKALGVLDALDEIRQD